MKDIPSAKADKTGLDREKEGEGERVGKGRKITSQSGVKQQASEKVGSENK